MAEFQEVLKHRNRMCERYMDSKGFICTNCPIRNAKKETCSHFIFNNTKEAEEIIMKWAEEHPVQTNADKFKEVFGIDTHKETSLTFCPFINFGCDNDYSCEECKKNKWWQQEYKKPKGE